MTRLYEADAWLYDVAFDWDVSDEVDWLLERLGGDVREVLEPACGAARLFPYLLRRGVVPTGVDRSPAMLDRARLRLERTGQVPDLVLGDITDFDLGRRFDGALCPINSLAHLPDDESMAAHLACVARHLDRGRRYLVQLDLRPLDGEVGQTSDTWQAEADGVRLEVTWSVHDIDVAARRERHRSRIEIVEGPGAGRVVEEEHLMRVWCWPDWRLVVEGSPFDLVAVHDGDDEESPALSRDELHLGCSLAWHVLERR